METFCDKSTYPESVYNDKKGKALCRWKKSLTSAQGGKKRVAKKHTARGGRKTARRASGFEQGQT